MTNKPFNYSSAALAVLAITFGMACSGSTPAEEGALCGEQETMCFENPDYILHCDDESGTWEALPCEEGTLCYDGECRDIDCVPGSRTCEGDSVLICRDDGMGMLYPEECPEGETCYDGECLPRVCEPGDVQCADDATVERCENNGTVWRTSHDCPEGTSCLNDTCLPSTCEPGETKCGADVLYTCDDDGEWLAEPCPDGQPCLFGSCVSCVSHDGCGEGYVCEEGECIETSPELTTASLPPGTEGLLYEAHLEVSGGLEPFTWEVVDGALPSGVDLFDDGSLYGTPELAGTSTFTINVSDANESFDEREYSIEIVPEGGELRLMTTTLPNAMHGMSYDVELQATGGLPPYGWQLLAGSAPLGVDLSASGVLSGVPEEIGTFPMTVRVVDGLTPPSYDTAELELTVDIAPIEIIGETEYDLLLTKIIILPMLIPYVPYSTDLEARGGLPPYTWTEEPPPSGLDWIIPEWGLPDGLSMSADGSLSGWVTDVSDAVEVSIPFTDISLTGYFFSAKVTDDQDPADTDEAVFCVPTVPL